MWLGEQITEFGIGNGISIILFALASSPASPHGQRRLPASPPGWTPDPGGVHCHELGEAQIAAYQKSLAGPWMVAVVILGMLALVVFIVFISNAERRLPVQYAKRVVGRKMYGGPVHPYPHQGEHARRRHAHHLRPVHRLPPATIGAFAGWTLESQGFGGGLMRLFDTSKPFTACCTSC